MAYWTLELASYIESAPFPLTIDELIDFAENRACAPLTVKENLEEMREEFGTDDVESITDIWPDYIDWQDSIPDGDDEGSLG